MTKILANSQGKVLKATNGGVFLAPEGSSSSEVPTYTVTWFDYDGTILKQEEVNEGGSSTAPTVPTHQYLTFREWVHGNTITNVKQDYFNIARYAYMQPGYLRKVNVTADLGNTLSIGAYKDYNGSVQIDWGDGTTETYSTAAYNFEVSHTYAAPFSGYVLMTLLSGSTLSSTNNAGSFECGVEEYYYGTDMTVKDYPNLGYFNKFLKAVVLPEGITTLPNRLFYGYTPKVLAVPPTVTTFPQIFYGINDYMDCFEAINIPAVTTTLANDLFLYRKNLRFVTNTIAATSIGYRCFAETGIGGDLTFTGNITSLGGGAFHRSKVRSLSFANGTFTSLANYGQGFCFECSNLEEITLPSASTITKLENGAFAYCTSLKTIKNFPKAAATLGNEVFRDCVSLENNIEFTSITSLGNGVFSNCKKIPSISLGGTFTALNTHSYGMFYHCESATSISIPNTVTTYGNGCFDSCYSLTSVPFSTALTTVGNTALYALLSVETLSLPNNACTYAHGNVDSMFNLKTVYIGSGVTISNSSNWFRSLTNLLSVDCADGWVPTVNLNGFQNAPFVTASSWVTFFTHLGTTSTARTIQLGNVNLNKLTAAEKAIATNKGYTLST